MKEYPSIPGCTKAPRKPCYAFQKLDGSNLRFEWHRKTGWQDKAGTRKRLFDETDEMFADAKILFRNTLADDLERVFNKDKILRQQQTITVYVEYYGPLSFAGLHDLYEERNTPMQVRLFDVCLHKHGMIGPKRFLKLFSHLPIPELVYQGNLNNEFIQDVKNGEYNVGDSIDGIEEGVVCKGGSGGDDLWMCKIKTDAYIEKLKKVFSGKWEQYV